MTHSPQRRSLFLVLFILVWLSAADIWAIATGHDSGMLGVATHLLLVIIALGAVWRFLSRPQPTDDASEALARWRVEMESYIRMSANGHVRDALRRQAASDARAAQALRDQGKYGMRRAGSTSPIPEDIRTPDPDAPTRVRSPAARPGSEPSSS